MANKYYYLASSLPFVAFGKPAPITSVHFQEECQKWLTASDLEALRDIDDVNVETDPEDRGFKGEWREFDVSLRKTLSDARSALKVAHEERVRGLARDILDRLTPLEMENRFEEIRWSFLEEKETDYHFDLYWLMVYYLKLKICQRLQMFKIEEGKQAFEEICEVKV
ncbi:MAG: DUF2764 family protein [Candidatus Omnitrophica bacterium]|nr:DUF2764 family protein [Candidatus Omnitrophota bacterium]